MNTYDVTFQTAGYTLHATGEGADEDSAVEDASKRLLEDYGIDTSKASVVEVVNTEEEEEED